MTRRSASFAKADLTNALSAVQPRGLCRSDAAAYVGIGTTMFDQLVLAGRMPAPARLNGRLIWDRRALDRALDDLFDTTAAAPADNPWGEVAP